MSVPAPLADAIQAAETAFDLPTGVLERIWAWESGRTYPNPAVNSIGCGGLFGLCNGGSAAGINLLDPSTTVAQANQAARTLAGLIQRYNGNLGEALNAYDGGSVSETQFILQGVGSTVTSAVQGVQSLSQNVLTQLEAVFGSGVTITQPFGPTTYTGEPSYDGYAHFHEGIDYAVPSGTPLPSLVAGTVTQAGENDGFGNSVTVSFGNGMTILYGHMQSVAVAVGQSVGIGQIVGLSNNTGNSTGPHVHVQEEENGKPIDPSNLIQSVLDGTYTGGTTSNVDAISNPLSGITDSIEVFASDLKTVLDDINNVFTFITDVKHWKQLGLLLAGGTIIVTGAALILFDQEHTETVHIE